MNHNVLRRIIRAAIEHGEEAALALAEDSRVAEIEAAEAFEHDDSEWADERRGYGQSDDIVRNEAGEFIGLM